MKIYVSIFDELKNESGRIAKENILKKHENVAGLKEIFKFAFNPLITTGLAKRKIEKKVNISHEIDLNSIFEAMNFVKDNNTGNDLVIATVQNFLNKLETQEEKDLAIGILTKDMPYGLSRVTLNKVYGKDFIEKYSVMLSGKYIPHKFDLSNGFSLSLKLDGNRVTVFNFEEGPKFFTRSGKEVEGLVELEAIFRRDLPKNMVYDGELLAKNPDNLPSSELFNVTQTIVRRKGEKIGLNFVMFDLLPLNEFNNGVSKKVYKDRMVELDELFKNHIKVETYIKKVPMYYVGTDEDKIPEILAMVEEQGYEGLMLNLLDAPYQTVRSKGLLKIKTFHTVDLRCIGINEEVRGGKCGSLSVDYKGHKVNVPILSHKEQKLFWENPELVIGKVIEVKYFEESSNAHDGISLRFPSFIRVREKDVVSYA